MRARTWAPALGLAGAVALVVAAYVVPAATGWDVHLKQVPPLHADWLPRVGPGTVPAVALAAAAAAWAVPVAERLPWRGLLVATLLTGLAWSLALAFVDGRDGIGLLLDQRNEYLATARATDDVGALLREYVDRIPLAAEDNWPVHVAGHPPGAVLLFVALVRLGLGSGLEAGLVVTVLAATTPLAVLHTVRTLGAEGHARRAAPFLCLGPAAVWQAVSADAVFAAVGAWGIAALAHGAVHRRPLWAVVAGLLLGATVMLSYGLPLLGVLALAVLLLSRSWWPLPVAAVAALAVVGAFALLGFDYLEALPVLHERYWDGVASRRPTSYWLWGNLAAFVVAAGPMVGAGLTGLRRGSSVVSGLAVAGVLMILAADVSLMSKGEVERIWLPFLPWVLLLVALLPERWRRAGLVGQLATALLVQHLLFTNW